MREPLAASQRRAHFDSPTVCTGLDHFGPFSYLRWQPHFNFAMARLQTGGIHFKAAWKKKRKTFREAAEREKSVNEAKGEPRVVRRCLGQSACWPQKAVLLKAQREADLGIFHLARLTLSQLFVSESIGKALRLLSTILLLSFTTTYPPVDQSVKMVR